jgi:hypothetical protein
MLIIDSLLMSRFFLSRRGAENPLSFFLIAQAQAATVSKAGCGAHSLEPSYG